MPDVFDPSILQRFQVIHVYYEYPGQGGDFKYFVVISHEEFEEVNYVLCMKATSKTQKYENDKSQLAGCVFYIENETECFPEKTIIQPDNLHPISYAHLIEQEKRGRFRDRGSLPNDFKEKLIGAVNQSVTLSPKRKTEILDRIRK